MACVYNIKIEYRLTTSNPFFHFQKFKTTIAVSVGCIVVAEDYLLYAISVINIIIAPVSINSYQEYRRKLVTAETAEDLKKNSEDQGNAVGSLRKSTAQMSDSAAKIKELEESLDSITKTQGQSIEKLEGQVKDNEKIVKEMRRNMKTIVLQSLLTIIISNDTNGDFHIDSEEVDPLCDALRTTIEAMSGVTFFEQRFRETVGDGLGIKDMMLVIKNLENPGPIGAIFEFTQTDDESTEGDGEQKEDE